ncbi:hypothetical protein LshimejAT787_0904530 [Lyophyllum shimeji]|uniref:Uncharacterized protein n=1 Tax=Lyophyllum shimeji TaxID=47721 RepID=A0A9P3PTD8_LYOSH|nr:hypothetical protein LshimejAT787_0904530 [Lyophyllum shimeji]
MDQGFFLRRRGRRYIVLAKHVTGMLPCSKPSRHPRKLKLTLRGLEVNEAAVERGEMCCAQVIAITPLPRKNAYGRSSHFPSILAPSPPTTSQVAAQQ